MAQCLVVGSPIAHSLSPVMHRAAYALHGLTWSYDRRDVTEGRLAEFVHELADDVRGLSVTAPLKPEAASLADERSEAVSELGIANTLVRSRTGWSAHNTDIDGALNALAEVGVVETPKARILGAGSTAIAMAYALASRGTESIEFVVREPSRAAHAVELVSQCGAVAEVRLLTEPPADDVDVVVSTVPVAASAPLAEAWVAHSDAVFDVVYDPWPTALATAAEQAAIPIVSGLDLLAHQAALQVRLMAGVDVDASVLRTAALSALRS